MATLKAVKTNAPRNRTIRLDDAERTRLSPLLLLAPESGLSLEDALDRVIHGSILQVAPLLPRACVDILIADPPYNMDKDFGGNRGRKLSDDDYAAFTASWLDAVMPLLKSDASVYVCGDWRSSAAVYRELSERFAVRNRISWEREKGRAALHNWKNSSEDIWFATVSDSYAFNASAVRIRKKVLAPYRTESGEPKDWIESPDGAWRDTAASNLWTDLVVPYWSMSENTEHPTQKPEKLIAKLLLASSNPGSLLLDPFLGSGTSAVTAQKLGRRFIGVELDREWCMVALKRLEKAADDTRIQGYEDGVFWERNSGKRKI